MRLRQSPISNETVDLESALCTQYIVCTMPADRQTDRQNGVMGTVCVFLHHVSRKNVQQQNIWLKTCNLEVQRAIEGKNCVALTFSTLVPNPAGLSFKTKHHIRRAGRYSGGAPAAMVSPSKAASWSDLRLKPTAGGSNADQTAAVAGGHPELTGFS